MTDQNSNTKSFISTGLDGIVSKRTATSTQLDKVIEKKLIQEIEAKTAKKSPLHSIQLLSPNILPLIRTNHLTKTAQAFFRENYRIGFKSAQSGVMNTYGGMSHNAICDRLFNMLNLEDRTVQNRAYDSKELELLSNFLTRLIIDYKIKLHKGFSTKVGSGQYFLLPKKEALIIKKDTQVTAKIVGKKRMFDDLLERTYIKERSQNSFHNFAFDTNVLYLPNYALIKRTARTWSKPNILRFYKDHYHIVFTKDEDPKKIYKLNDLIYQDLLNHMFDNMLDNGLVLKEVKFKKDQLNELSTAIDKWINTGSLRGKFSLMSKTDATTLHNRTIQLRKRERKLAKVQKKDGLSVS